MKKITVLLLTIVMLLSLAACGNSNENTRTDTPTSTPSADNQPSGSETGPDDNDPTTPSSTDSRPSSGETEPSDDEPQINVEPREFKKIATIEETVLLNENDVKITAKELTYGKYAAELTLVIENNSDKDLSFISNSVGYSCTSINGYMIPDGYLNCDVAAGKKAKDTISISYDTLMLYGIFEIADIEIGFDICDDDYNHTYTDPITIQTTAADSYDYENPCYRENIASKEFQAEYDYVVPYFSANAVYEENGLVIASQAVVENADGESILLLEIVNNTDEIVVVTTTNIDINGLRVCASTWSYDSINPGKTAIVDIGLSSVLEPEYWEIYGIAQVGNVALKVEFKNAESKEVATPAHISIDIPGSESSFSMEGAEIYNGNGIRIISKGVFADPSKYIDNLHILLVAENTSGKTLVLHDVYGSLSINEYMATYSFYTTTIEDGTCVMIDIILWGYSLEDIDISEPSEVKTVEFSLSIKDKNYKEIEEVTIAFTVE